MMSEFRSREMIVSMVLYAFLVIIVFGVCLGFSGAGDGLADIASGLLWAMIIFTSLLGLNRSFSKEVENSCIDGLLLTPMDRGVIFLAKAVSNLIFLLVVEIIAIPLFLFFFASFTTFGEGTLFIAWPILLGTIGIAGVGTLLSTITCAVRGRDVMLALLFVPISFPLLYACASATQGAIVGGAAWEGYALSLFLAAAFDIVMIAISWLLYQFVVSS